MLLLKCRVVLCIWLGVWSMWVRVRVWSRALDGPQAASFEVPELGKRDPALGTQGRRPDGNGKPNRVLTLCQVVGSWGFAMMGFFGNGSCSWFLLCREGCKATSGAKRGIKADVWCGLAGAVPWLPCQRERRDELHAVCSDWPRVLQYGYISGGIYEPARGRGCGRRF
ncbi:hypothetical protein QBC39DRAFT_363112 [Podospora conica]|nr:hypothetical protein QBC39DRAFT_363112 [Schizothecium conicum]